MNCSVCYEHYSVSTSFFSVFPAGAGVIPVKAFVMALGESFPRRCGGDPVFPRLILAASLFSPQVRG